jgi:hypothetical protein
MGSELSRLSRLLVTSNVLDVPIQEFFPETLSIRNKNNHGHVGLLIGNFYHYGGEQSETTKELENQLKAKDMEIGFLKDKIASLEKVIVLLESRQERKE